MSNSIYSTGASVLLNNLQESSNNYTEALQRVSTGKRILKAADDPSGSAIAYGIEAEVRSSQAAQRNIMEGMSITNITESALNELSNVGIRMKELAIQAANDAISDRTREYLMTEMDELRGHAAAIVETTSYLGNPLLNGEGKNLEVQVSSKVVEGSTYVHPVDSVDTRDGLTKIFDAYIDDSENAADAVISIDEFVKSINEERAKVGGIAFRYKSIFEAERVHEENEMDRLNRYRDADLIKESFRATSELLRQKITIALLAQANSQQEYVLKLLDGSFFSK
jgi:flagellin